MNNSITLDTIAATATTNSTNDVVTSSPLLTGVYSNSGFDMINVLSRLMNRPNPQIQLGPIDLSCSFVVSDAHQFDCPIVYCSPAFERLTGYTNNEIVGKNCRFLQSPDGQVTCGSRRQHTDNQAVYYLKAQLNKGKEHQASIINYRKGGQPFVNLVTVIPILGDSGQVDYFVGLQVDLVEQPNSILEKMKDGTYLINYHQNTNALQPFRLKASSNNDDNSLLPYDFSIDEYFREIPSNPTATDIISLLDATRIDYEDAAFNEQQIEKEWNQLVLDQCCDFIHVLSLKGVFLYVSNSSSSILEYEPSELLKNSLSSICHPSDIVPVMRELKNAASNPDKAISLIYRIRRKKSGYIWIDCRGKLHMDQSKSRKCLVLSGREKPVYQLSRSQILRYSHQQLEEEREYWAKLSLAGLYLHVTSTCIDVVGFTCDSLEQESIYQYVENDSMTEITKALDTVKAGKGIASVSHTILNSKGTYVRVISTFYPGDNNYQPSFVLLQVKLPLPPLPITSNSQIPFSSSTDIATILKDENLFAELEPSRTTNWQYELHQLQQSNKRLRDQLEMYNNPSKQRRKKNIKFDDSGKPKMCAKCQRKDSPEWRKGPNGPKELCNACGLRYAKSLIHK